MNFNKLSLEEKFGQTIIMGLDTYELNDEIIDIIKTYKIGGIVLYKKNYTSTQNMIDFINKLKEINKDNKIPLFIGIDQENGLVNRLPKDLKTLVSPQKQSKADNLEYIKYVSEITANILRCIGVNMNFAPVIDINHGDKNKTFSTRCYGKNKDEVINKAMPFMNSLKENKIISVIKHFPGYGLAKREGKILTPRIRNVEELKNADLNVFSHFIKNGAEALMVSHIRIKGFGFKPATVNKKILDDLLIKKENYNGLIVTDDLRMGLINYFKSVKKQVKESINSGCNLIMIKYKKNDFKKLYAPLLKMVKYCEIDPELINNSAKKIVNLKQKYAITNEITNRELNLDEINKSITKINELISPKIEII